MHANQSWQSRARLAEIEQERASERACAASPAHAVPISEVCLNVGTPAFGEVFQRVINTVAPVDQTIIITFLRGSPSGYLLMVGRGNLDLALRLAEEFIAGGYLDDPNLRHVLEGASRPTVLPCSPAIWQGRFRHVFVEQGRVIDSIPCIAARDERIVYCNLVRIAPSSVYSERERARVGEIIPVLANLALAHYALCGPFLPRVRPRPYLNTPEDEVRFLRERLGHSPLDCLTERERQVCFLILLGYSSEAIGLHLGVARSTIISHRKRAYEKLGIASQSELFSLYLHALPEFRWDPQATEPAPAAAPLKVAMVSAKPSAQRVTKLRLTRTKPAVSLCGATS